MSDVATQAPEQSTNTQVQPESQPTQPDVNQQIANSLWGDNIGANIQTPAPIPDTPPAQTTTTTTTSDNPDNVETISVEEYFQREFGVDPVAAKAEWENLRKIKENPPAAAVPEFANEDSRKVFEAIKSGDTKPLYEYLQRQTELEQAANLSAAEAIKLHIKLTNPHYKPEDIADVFEEKYTFPVQPKQEEDESDEFFQVRMNQYNQSVEKINRRIERDAFTAKEGLSQLKSQLVFPDIPQANATQQQPDQKELEAKYEAARQDFIQNLGSNYQNFKGFSITAKDGEVELPINYTINPEELNASKQMLENFNVNEFLDQRWIDENGKPKINQMQEDLYLLMNRDKIFQKIANEASAQRFLHHQKTQNNIKLNGVNTDITPSQQPTKNESQVLAEKVWSM